MPSIDPKNIPGTVGMIVRGELQSICNYCGQGPEGHSGAGFSYSPIKDQFQLAVISAIYKRMGKDGFTPNPNNKALFLVQAGQCARRYSEESSKLYSEIVICDLCGLRDGSRSYEFSWLAPEGFVPETLVETFKRLDKEQYPPVHPNPAMAITGVPVLVFCPQCKEKFFDMHAAIVKEQNPRS